MSSWKIDGASPAWTFRQNYAGDCVLCAPKGVSLTSRARREPVESVVPSVEIARRYPTELSVPRCSVHGTSVVRSECRRRQRSRRRDSEKNARYATVSRECRREYSSRVSRVQRRDLRDHRGKWRTSRRCWPTSATWWPWRRAKAHRLPVRARRSSCQILGISRDSCRPTRRFFPVPPPPIVASALAMGTTYSWPVLELRSKRFAIRWEFIAYPSTFSHSLGLRYPELTLRTCRI